MALDHQQLGEFTHSFLQRALDKGVIEQAQHTFLSECLENFPELGESSLDPDTAEQFIQTTLQLIEVCLADKEHTRSGFVNPIIQKELDRCCQESGGKDWSLVPVSESGRRGQDRQFTFGQVKQNPDDPDDPSFFGGVWTANCDGNSRRVAFAIFADVIPGSEEWKPLADTEDSVTELEQQVRSRGPRPWQLQVEPESPLGLWIAKLSGDHKYRPTHRTYLSRSSRGGGATSSGAARAQSPALGTKPQGSSH